MKKKKVAREKTCSRIHKQHQQKRGHNRHRKYGRVEVRSEGGGKEMRSSMGIERQKRNRVAKKGRGRERK